MSVKLTCPECEAPLTVPDSFLGKTLRCKHCGETFKARAPRELEDDVAPPRKAKASTKRPRDDEDDEEDEDDRPVRKKGKKKAKSGGSLVFALGAGVALLLVVGAVVALLWSRGYFGTGESPAEADARKPADRPFAKNVEPEDYSQHVKLRFVELGVLKDDRPVIILELEFPQPRQNYSPYYTVSEDKNGKVSKSQLAAQDIKDGKYKYFVVAGRPGDDFRFRFWIARRKVKGKEEDFVPVSNIVSVP
jgi:predicted Zn finger-like uncharacterized protein